MMQSYAFLCCPQNQSHKRFIRASDVCFPAVEWLPLHKISTHENRQHIRQPSRNSANHAAFHSFQYYGSLAFTGRSDHRRPPRLRRLYRCHCHRWHHVQHDLLDFCLPAYGNDWHHFASLRQPPDRSRSQHPLPFAHDSFAVWSAPPAVSIADSPAGPLDHGTHCRCRQVCLALLLHLHLGRTGHAGPIRFHRLVSRHAGSPIPLVYCPLPEHRQHSLQPVLCLCESAWCRRCGLRHAHSPICRVVPGSWPLPQPVPQEAPLRPLLSPYAFRPCRPAPVFPGEPRYIPAHPLSRGRNALLHVFRFAPGQPYFSGQRAAHAVLHALFLLYGRSGLRRRSPFGQILRRRQYTKIPHHHPPSVSMGFCHCRSVHINLYRWWRTFPFLAHQRARCPFGSPPLSFLDLSDSRSRPVCLRLGRRIHRHHGNPPDAYLDVFRCRPVFHRIF